MRRLVLATRNRGKVAELRAMLAGVGLEVLGLEAFPDAPEVAETGGTFEANALLKARSAAAACGRPALADDSGLCLDALDGRPGVDSAIYGGPGLTDAERVEVVLRELAGLGLTSSPARFVCVMALVTPGGHERLVQATWEGVVGGPPRGTQGFGYDPIFHVAGRGLTAAELPAAEKNRLSHRGRALQQMLHVLVAEPQLTAD